MEKIAGSFPGGPRRRAEVDGPTEASERAFLRVEELSDRTTARFLRDRKRSRLKRVLWGFVMVLLAAGLTGLWVGVASHRTAEELAREQEAAAREARESEIAAERQKILQELWKMESLEKAPTPTTSGR